ncbi:hypothetical protein AsAng_0057560 [Aureispira anguillae]|uniref:Uncharacterized protein n=1 Tax=Aureispira anguillae TaxID=2864201 RepID=A0A915YL21_9BACT|nr:hypothetical protein AsAng_0057560 [Aureispira anguillae]
MNNIKFKHALRILQWLGYSKFFASILGRANYNFSSFVKEVTVRGFFCFFGKKDKKSVPFLCSF